jgi:hypothetical protein
VHLYPGPDSPKPETNRAAVCGEFGGIWCFTEGHMWSRPGYEYKPTKSHADVETGYEAMLRKVYALKDDPGMSAAVYCEITDVEVEQAGLLTYDREVCKVDWKRAAASNSGEFK